MRKICTLVIMGIMLMCMGTSVFAAEPKTELRNVSTKAPIIEEITVYGTNKPSESLYVDLSNGSTLAFSGEAANETLYTNKNFTGATKIAYTITNHTNTRLTVKFYKSNGIFATKTIRVEANATLSGTIDGFDQNTLYFLSFSHPSNFEGALTKG